MVDFSQQSPQRIKATPGLQWRELHCLQWRELQWRELQWRELQWRELNCLKPRGGLRGGWIIAPGINLEDFVPQRSVWLSSGLSNSAFGKIHVSTSTMISPFETAARLNKKIRSGGYPKKSWALAQPGQSATLDQRGYVLMWLPSDLKPKGVHLLTVTYIQKWYIWPFEFCFYHFFIVLVLAHYSDTTMK